MQSLSYCRTQQRDTVSIIKNLTETLIQTSVLSLIGQVYTYKLYIYTSFPFEKSWRFTLSVFYDVKMTDMK